MDPAYGTGWTRLKHKRSFPLLPAATPQRTRSRAVALLPAPRGPGREPQATQLSRPGRSRGAGQETTEVQTEAACPTEHEEVPCSSPQLPPGLSPPGGHWPLGWSPRPSRPQPHVRRQAVPGPTQDRGLVTLPTWPHQLGTQSCHGGLQTSSSRESQWDAHRPPNREKQGKFRAGGGYQKGPARSHVPSH